MSGIEDTPDGSRSPQKLWDLLSTWQPSGQDYVGDAVDRIAPQIGDSLSQIMRTAARFSAYIHGETSLAATYDELKNLAAFGPSSETNLDNGYKFPYPISRESIDKLSDAEKGKLSKILARYIPADLLPKTITGESVYMLG